MWKSRSITLRSFRLLFSDSQVKCSSYKSIKNERNRHKRFLKNVPSTSPSSSQINSLIRQKWNDYMMKEVKDERQNNYVFDSLATESYFQSNSDAYCLIKQKRDQIVEEKKKNECSEGEKSEIFFPLEGKPLEKLSIDDVSEKVAPKNADGFFVDRGFHVHSGHFADDYSRGSALEIPDKMNELSNYVRYGSENAVEEIEFQLPCQSINFEKMSSPPDLDEEIFTDINNGSVDPSLPTSKVRCAGCGANFHSKEPSLPGFLPAEILIKLKDHEDSLCRRCYMLKKYNFLLNVNICEVDYRSVMKHLKLREEALIILVVDMTDLPSSIFKSLPNIIGFKKPMIVVGNKVDLLPPDTRSGYLKHFRQTLADAVESFEFNKSFNILHTALISARTGFGIEELVTNIFLKWSTISTKMNDIYLVGCTNTGKSTLFNIFLQSDLCKIRAVGLVERATTSIWPGTTISLLKFPVMNPTSYKLELRRRRLLLNRSWEMKERKLNRDSFKETGNSDFTVLRGNVENTFKDKEEAVQPISYNDIRRQFEDGPIEKQKIWNADEEVFARGRWCFDTPGTVNRQQIINYFTLDELINLIPRKMIIPRTYIIYPGESLLIGGVGRVDLLEIGSETKKAAYMSVFASECLPINAMKTIDVQSFYERHWGTPALVVPSGTAERLSKFPKLEGREIKFYGKGNDIGAADIILSSIGWLCVTTTLDAEISLLAYTPAAKGIFLRTPPILPYCAINRGRRIHGTAAYETRLLLPKNEKRMRRSRQIEKKSE